VKRIVSGIVIALAGLAVAMAASNGPVAMDWHQGGHLYVLLKNGSVSVLDETTKQRLATIPALFGTVPVEIYSARLKEHEYVFVSGFSGRSATVLQYTAEGKLYARFETPEQAASFDLDPARHLLYVASPVTNLVYSIDLDQHGSSAKRVANIRGAVAVGPVIFDQGRNRVIVGDAGSGVLYDVDVTTGSYQQFGSDLGHPVSLGFDAVFRTLFVADSGSGRIQVFRLQNGAFKRAETITTSLRSLSGVTPGPADTLFIADGAGAYQLALRTMKLTRFAY
jgi:6-phosphogluconolactonase (cycloisomerase 2 family)